MENKVNFKELTLNFKGLKLSTNILDKYCSEERSNTTLSLSKNRIISFFSQYNLPKTEIKITSMTLNSEGLYLNINNEIDHILSRYNLPKDTNNIKKELDNTIEKLQLIKRSNKLKEQYPKLYEDYLKDEIKFRNKNRIPKSKKVPPIITKRFIKKEIEKICFLKRKATYNFSELTNIGKYLNETEINRLKLVIAYQMMNVYKKEDLKEKSLKYLQEFLIINKDLLSQNYQFKIKKATKLGIEEYETLSIKEIQNFVNQKTKPINIQEEKSNYSFIDVKKEKHYEILGKYLKLGLSSKSEEEQKEILKRKIDFLYQLKADKVKIGIKSFEGYIGICLEDGSIILDKLFDNIKDAKIATNEAIYITTEEEFINIMQLTKPECIKKINEGLVKAERVIHKGLWETRVEEKRKKLIRKKESMSE